VGALRGVPNTHSLRVEHAGDARVEVGEAIAWKAQVSVAVLALA
jgi:hypothetical protein